jgi:hypothetical protein
MFFSYTALAILTTLFSSANYINENDETFQGWECSYQSALIPCMKSSDRSIKYLPRPSSNC